MNSEQYIDSKLVFDFFKLLNDYDVNYVMIKNIGNELPYHLKDGKDIDILVHLEDRKKFTDVMTKGVFLKRIPPLGSERGYRFGYQLPEYQFWQKGGIKQTFYIDACFMLMCKSLTPNYWVPLDSSINDRVWKKKVWNKELGCWQTDDKTLLVYMLARCVFDKHGFSNAYKEDIEKKKQLIHDDSVQEMLHTVFYRFTEKISSMVISGEYDAIFDAYMRFTDY